MAAIGKIYDASEGVGVDERRGLYVLAYRETVPSIWKLRRVRPARPANPAFVEAFLTGRRKRVSLAIIGAIVGAVLASNGAQIIPCAILCAAIGYSIARWGKAPKPRAQLSTLTGTPDRDDMVTDFAVQVEIDGDGVAELYQEFGSSNPNTAGTYGPAQFYLADVASVELQSWDQTFPDTDRNPQSGIGQKIREETRAFEKVVIVFKNGESVGAGWQASHNAAARAQTLLRGFFRDIGQQLDVREKKAARAAKIAPDDAPL